MSWTMPPPQDPVQRRLSWLHQRVTTSGRRIRRREEHVRSLSAFLDTCTTEGHFGMSAETIDGHRIPVLGLQGPPDPQAVLARALESGLVAGTEDRYQVVLHKTLPDGTADPAPALLLRIDWVPLPDVQGSAFDVLLAWDRELRARGSLTVRGITLEGATLEEGAASILSGERVRLTITELDAALERVRPGVFGGPAPRPSDTAQLMCSLVPSQDESFAIFYTRRFAAPEYLFDGVAVLETALAEERLAVAEKEHRAAQQQARGPVTVRPGVPVDPGSPGR